MHPTTRQSDLQRLQHRVMTLATDRHVFEQRITELEAENATLRAELAASLLPYRGHTVKVINGVATVFLHGGAVYERVQRCVESPTEVRFEWHWRKVEAIPTSPAERIDAVAPALCEMAVFDDAVGAA